MTIVPYAAAVVQMPLHGYNDHEEVRAQMLRNANRVAALLDRLVAISDEPLRLVVLPVLALSGIGTAMRRLGIQASFGQGAGALSLEDDPVLEPIRAVCAKHDLYVATSGVEHNPKMPGRYFHTGYIIGPRGLVLRCPKTQAPTSSGITLLHTIADEYMAVFGPDAILPVAETPIGTLACLVEGEYLVSEAVRTVAMKGAEIICHPTAHFNEPGRPPAPGIQQANAYLNGVYWLSGCISSEKVDWKGQHIEFQFGGGAVICDPDGSVKAHLPGPGEGHAIATIDLGHLHDVRPEQATHTAPAKNLYRKLYE